MIGDCDTCPRSEYCNDFESGEICFEVSDRKENKDSIDSYLKKIRKRISELEEE